MTLRRWIVQYLSAIRWMFLGIVALMTLETVSGIAITDTQKYIINDVFEKGQYQLVVPLMLLFALSFVGFNLLNVYAGQARLRARFVLQAKLTQYLMTFIQQMKVARYQNERIAQYVNYFTNDIPRVAQFMAGEIPSGIQMAIRLMILVAVLALSNPFILLGTLSLTGVYFFVGRKLWPSVRQATRATLDTRATVQVVIEEAIASSREVAAFAREQWEIQRYQRVFQRLYQQVIKEGKLFNRAITLTEPLRFAVTLLVLAYGGYCVMKGVMSLGTFVVLYQFSTQLMETTNGFLNYLLSLNGQTASCRRLLDVLATPADSTGTTALPETSIQSIVLHDVTFQHPDSPVLVRNLSLTLPTGKKIALAGPSGSGKSTLAHLLLRMYDPTYGWISLNGVPLNDLRKEDLAHHMTMVFQEPFLFPDTIRNNLLLGRATITEAQMVQACQAMEIHETIQALPDQYDTWVGERGQRLSGGQRQRLALARAILHQPDILILDEATSALDVETERIIQSRLDAMRAGQTTLIIAHRLSTIQNAEVIYVMDHGAIVEQGTHDTLLRNNGTYQRLVSAGLPAETRVSV